jgi:hypothetical protein
MRQYRSELRIDVSERGCAIRWAATNYGPDCADNVSSLGCFCDLINGKIDGGRGGSRRRRPHEAAALFISRRELWTQRGDLRGPRIRSDVWQRWHMVTARQRKSMRECPNSRSWHSPGAVHVSRCEILAERGDLRGPTFRPDMQHRWRMETSDGRRWFRQSVRKRANSSSYLPGGPCCG